jgi:hypothetical protein
MRWRGYIGRDARGQAVKQHNGNPDFLSNKDQNNIAHDTAKTEFFGRDST